MRLGKEGWGRPLFQKGPFPSPNRTPIPLKCSVGGEAAQREPVPLGEGGGTACRVKRPYMPCYRKTGEISLGLGLYQKRRG